METMRIRKRNNQNLNVSTCGGEYGRYWAGWDIAKALGQDFVTDCGMVLHCDAVQQSTDTAYMRLVDCISGKRYTSMGDGHPLEDAKSTDLVTALCNSPG